MVVLGCKTKPEDVMPPAHVLGKEQMIELMVDVHLAQAMGFMLRIEEVDKEELVKQEYTKVLKVHNITLEKLLESHKWYIEHPVVFDLMYDEIIERIKMEEQFANEHQEDEASTVEEAADSVKEDERKRRLFELNKIPSPD